MVGQAPPYEAPSFALEKDDIGAKLKQIPQIKPGNKVYLGEQVSVVRGQQS
jgi:hypothetical protein